MVCEFVAVGKTPRSLMLLSWLAFGGLLPLPPPLDDDALLLELFLLALEPTTPPTTAAMMITSKMGSPNLS